MQENSELFVGLDTSKLKISVAVAEGERNGEVRFYGDISAEPASVVSMVAKLARRGAKLSVTKPVQPATTRTIKSAPDPNTDPVQGTISLRSDH
jgi:hypothetical protein